EVPIPQVGLGARHRAPQRHGRVHLAGAAPVQQAAAQDVVAVAPKPGVVDVGVPVTERDVVRMLGQIAPYRSLVGQEAGRVMAKVRNELLRTDVRGQQPGARFHEVGELPESPIPLYTADPCFIAAPCCWRLTREQYPERYALGPVA